MTNEHPLHVLGAKIMYTKRNLVMFLHLYIIIGFLSIFARVVKNFSLEDDNERFQLKKLYLFVKGFLLF